MSEADQIFREFLAESREGLVRAENDLIALEDDPQDTQRIASIFRTLHSLKGSCGFLQFRKLHKLAHAGENLLAEVRAGELSFTTAMANALLALVDACRTFLRALENTGSEGVANYEDLIHTLTRLTDSGSGRPAALPGESLGSNAGAVADPESPPWDVTVADRPPDATTESWPVAVEPSAESGRAELSQTIRPDQERSTADQVRKTPAEAESASVLASSNIRVDVHVLDKLMNLVGELVLTRNQLKQFATEWTDPDLASIAQRLNLVTTDLQDGVLKTRMQRIGGMWQRFPRLVRDLAHECGKEVALAMSGIETELDRSLIESMSDPLTHIVRNAIDHGIEMPDERLAKGKPPQGQLVLRAVHESGQVLIEISDDGAGIEVERLRQKLIERGLMSIQQAAVLNARAIRNCIFLAGFSTVDKVTHVSGRGVGLDVVRTNIERCGGTVDVDSEPGRGTTLRIRLPLTLAIIPALLVTTGDRCYAIPQVNLVELLSLEPRQVGTDIERIRGTEVYRLRGRLLPLVHLNRVLGLGAARPMAASTVLATGDAGHTDAPPPAAGFFNIVVLRVNDYRFGLVVDDIHNSEEIVVKPLGNTLKGLPLYAGATILGDGQVALILDVLGLARSAGMFGAERESLVKHETSAVLTPSRAEHLLLCDVDGYRVAVPLAQVQCLEEFPASAVGRLVGRDVVEFRNGLLPLVPLRQLLLHDGRDVRPETLSVIVVADAQQRPVGFVVSNILDVAEQPETVLRPERRGLVTGSVMINGTATDLVDLAAAVLLADLPQLPETTHSK